MSYYSLMQEYLKAQTSLGRMESKMSNYILKCERELEKYKRIYEASEVLYGEVESNFTARSKEIENQINSMLTKARSDLQMVVLQKFNAANLYQMYLNLYLAELDW